MNVDKLEASLSRLEAMVDQAEARLRALSDENARLRAALGEGDTAGSGNGGQPESRPFRLILLESERQEIRSRIRNVIDAL